MLASLAVQLLPLLLVLSHEDPPASRCRGQDYVSAETIHTLQSLATSNEPGDRLLKDALRLLLQETGDVSLVSSEKTCRRAAAELDRLWRSGPTGRRVYVYVVGEDYAVEDPEAGSGDYHGVAFFTSDWTYKSLLLEP